jgi:hypothetical protein
MASICGKKALSSIGDESGYDRMRGWVRGGWMRSGFGRVSEDGLFLPWHIWGEVLLFSLLLAFVFHVLLDRNRRE